MPSICRSLLLLAALWGAAAAARAQHAFEVKTPGVLRVLVQAEGLKEIFSLDSTSGLEREMLQGFANLHGLKIELVLVPTTGEWVSWLLAGKGDVITGGLVATESRKRQVEHFGADALDVLKRSRE